MPPVTATLPAVDSRRMSPLVTLIAPVACNAPAVAVAARSPVPIVTAATLRLVAASMVTPAVPAVPSVMPPVTATLPAVDSRRMSPLVTLIAPVAFNAPAVAVAARSPVPIVTAATARLVAASMVTPVVSAVPSVMPPVTATLPAVDSTRMSPRVTLIAPVACNEPAVAVAARSPVPIVTSANVRSAAAASVTPLAEAVTTVKAPVNSRFPATDSRSMLPRATSMSAEMASGPSNVLITTSPAVTVIPPDSVRESTSVYCTPVPLGSVSSRVSRSLSGLVNRKPDGPRASATIALP